MYWIKLAGATDAADTTGQVSIEIPILGIEWTSELIGDTVTYADGTVKEPVQHRTTPDNIYYQSNSFYYKRLHC